MSLGDRAVLAEELEHLRDIVSDSTEFIKRWRPDGTRTYVNDAYCRYFGCIREEIVGTCFFEDLSQKEMQVLVEEITQLTPENPVRIGEYASEIEDSKAWIEWTDRGIFDRDGQLTEVHSAGRDVTDRHIATEALSDSEEKYRKLVEEASDTVLVSSKAGELLHINPAGLALLGFATREEGPWRRRPLSVC